MIVALVPAPREEPNCAIIILLAKDGAGRLREARDLKWRYCTVGTQRRGRLVGQARALNGVSRTLTVACAAATGTVTLLVPLPEPMPS